jgi:hypothetical protein
MTMLPLGLGIEDFSMTHIAIQESLDSKSVDLTEKVSDERTDPVQQEHFRREVA